MKVWLQRVTESSVEVDGEILSRIGIGYLVLLGVGLGDTPSAADTLAARVAALRVFEDENGKINKSIQDVQGEVLVISQFTLYADTAHGRRPGFSNARVPSLPNRSTNALSRSCASFLALAASAQAASVPT